MIYQIKNDDEKYQILNFDPQALYELYADNPETVDMIMAQPDTNVSLKDIWKEMTCSFHSASRKGTPVKPNITYFMSFLALDDKSFSVLSPLLEPYGEFLTIDADGEQYWLFNCLSFGKEDHDECVFEYSNGIQIGLKKLVFQQDDVDEKPVFKSKLLYGEPLFCSSVFKKAYDEADLEGLVFDEDLLSIF